MSLSRFLHSFFRETYSASIACAVQKDLDMLGELRGIFCLQLFLLHCYSKVKLHEFLDSIALLDCRSLVAGVSLLVASISDLTTDDQHFCQRVVCVTQLTLWK